MENFQIMIKWAETFQKVWLIQWITKYPGKGYLSFYSYIGSKKNLENTSWLSDWQQSILSILYYSIWLKMCFLLFLFSVYNQCKGFFGGSVVKKPPVNAADKVLISGSGRSPGEGNGNPLEYSCLGNPMDRGAWWATAHGVTRVRHNLATDNNKGKAK